MDAKTAREKALSVQIKRFEGIVSAIIQRIAQEVEREKFEYGINVEADERQYVIDELSKLGYVVSSEPSDSYENMYFLTIKW
jgi:hypothetical protein